MSARESDHRQINAERQRDDVQKRVRTALQALRAEIDANVINGKRAYPRRLSLSEVLRRAGGVDKNTLRQPYHGALRAEIEQFLASAWTAFPSRKNNGRSPTGGSLRNLDHYAQMLVAAQILRDEAIRKQKELQAELDQLKGKIAVLETQNESRRQAGTNVVPIDGGSS